MPSDFRSTFFKLLFEGSSGEYICLATRNARTSVFHEMFYEYPDGLNDFLDAADKNRLSCDVYFCPTLLREPKRKKVNVATSLCAWADLDECPPTAMLVEPTLVTRTSANKTQAYWVFRDPQNALVVEELNRRIAYYHADEGCDKSGWDLTQLLRFPGTNNHKYSHDLGLFNIQLEESRALRYEPSDFDVYPPVVGISAPTEEALQLPDLTSEQILDRVRLSINPKVWNLVETQPETDWSKSMWQLELLLFDVGLTAEEVFIVVRDSACNKYKRDNKSQDLLWREVCRAREASQGPSFQVPVKGEVLEDDVLVVPNEPLLTDAERASCENGTTIVEEYIEWAKSLGDAAWQYHQAGAFIILSSLLSGQISLPTSFGVVRPNLWFMILADTTLTRKTTAIDMAIDLLMEIDPDAVLATDGSIEGLMTSLSMRPGKPSIFLRDEFSGLLDALTKKDYMAGMLEMFTKLYDGKFQKRVLRKETIEVRDPILILFTGGIRERILQLLTFEHVASGFIPRFCFITAESDITKLKPLGPPTASVLERRHRLTEQFKQLYLFYNTELTVKANGSAINLPKRWQGELTDDAWVRYNKFESQMLEAGLEANLKDLMVPVFDRLAKSGLKVAVLLAACRMEEKVVVTESDILRAIYYVEQWRQHTLEVVSNIGKSTQERSLESAFNTIRKQPGILRSKLMQTHRLTARDADTVLITLEQRQLISRQRAGRGEALYPMEVS